jgi:serine/threonine-protein kinase
MIRTVAPLHVGDHLDDYRVDSLVARGGMASIFRGTDLRSGLTIAIKIPHPEAECDPVFYDRFRREEEICRVMDHRGIVKEISGGNKSRVYMVLEWVEGQLLRDLLTRPVVLPADRAARIAVSICEALEYIHSRGVVHRDLKPENVMVGARDEVKLLDFGIAAMRGTRRLTFGKLSRITGTADYMAPEQVRGKRGDARTDIYALGVMLYEMLTGRLPFEEKNVFAAMKQRLYRDPTPPGEINPEISPPLEEVVCRAMESDPRNRYASAREMAVELDRHGCSGIAAAVDGQVLRRGRQRGSGSQRDSLSKRILTYASLAMIPMLIFGLMLFVAHHF